MSLGSERDTITGNCIKNQGAPGMTSLMFRVSVMLGLVGMGLGIVMGIRQDFALAPAHAHLNLLGFVTLFLSALYYRVVPAAAAGALARLQAAGAMVGAVVFPIGIALVLLGGHERFQPVVVTGALLVFIGMGLFALIVWRTAHLAEAPRGLLADRAMENNRTAHARS
jgi:hypothetical protein